MFVIYYQHDCLKKYGNIARLIIIICTLKQTYVT